MNREASEPGPVTYYVDEAGDGVLFGPKGRNRLDDPDGRQFFMLGMVSCGNDGEAAAALTDLRTQLQGNPLYATVHSMQPGAGKTAVSFHAKDDHAEIRAKVFELLLGLDFKFYAVVKDMRAVLAYVRGRNQIHSGYRYHPNETYDFAVRLLFKERLHQHDRYRIVFARRGTSDRTAALASELERARLRHLEKVGIEHQPSIEIVPAYAREQGCLQIADYCLWALQRCYERHEARFLNALWPKIALVRDVDAPSGKGYGRYLTKKHPPPDPLEIKNRRI